MNYKDEEIRLIVQNVANDSEGFKFLEILLDKLGAYERGAKFDNSNMEYFNRGKREQGLWLLDLLRDSNFEMYKKIEEKRRTNLCQKPIKD